MISIILPTRKRYLQLEKVLANIHNTTDVPYEIILIVDKDDPESIDIAEGNGRIIISYSADAVTKWNEGAKQSKFDWLFPAADDIILPNNWASKVLATPNQGFIAIADQNPNLRPWQPFFLVNKDWLRKYHGGVFMVPHYKSWGVDVEICSRAINSGTYNLSGTSLIHKHVIFGLADPDETYLRAQKYWGTDIETLNQRMLNGFPNDFEGYL